ncbi:hypothetical protein FCL47_17060 [Desulfopila sp. IMCC35006]|uniref:nSTAND3 domain-containing NTPase n=1 Tax=Desulfopila sp. IMCC35006 TaxID=2569542 RepID=UPI0010ABA70F|nr:hypothetical protein [Desulfopila sp. IMCC35006]TKB24550.1 hypothetical protein FCL47_17060 [Desulfopila sp. IMCC35006]
MTSKRAQKQPQKRRTATSSGPPAQSRRKSGNPGFSGYEYQIEVSVWVALDLMLAKDVTEEIEIEPRSEEDIQAAVTDPSSASLGLQVHCTQFHLIMQAKTRSSSPWSSTVFADILLGKDADVTNQGARRRRPLTMLQADPHGRYIFVTNEASTEALRPHEGTHLFDFPEVDELPPHTRHGFDSTARASLAPRIVLLTGVTREVLCGRIAALLSQYGHVPISRHDGCLRDLREAVRRRIEGAHGGLWTRSEVIEVLVNHGGSLAPTRDMDHYVRPKSFDAIKAQLDTAHAVVIAGPSGTGKTLTADILELDLRRGSPPFDVVGEESGPGFIRGNLTRTDPVLFHLRDPWGGNRLTPGADRWSGELPKLLDNAGPGRKFLITSRSDVMQSAGNELAKELRPYIVSIEVEDYGADLLAEIYDGLAADLTGHSKHLAAQYRKRALAVLTRPFEVKRFMVALSREAGEKPRKVDEIIADSQIEAISGVIAKQVGADGAEAAAIIWAMLSARKAVARDVFAKFGRRLRSAVPNLRPDVEGLIDFLVAGQNLRQDGAALAFYHPRVEDGLRLTFMLRPLDAERILSTSVDVLFAWDRAGEDWGMETGLKVLQTTAKVKELELDLSPVTTQRLDQYLEAVALSSANRADFEGALRDLARFGSDDNPPARLARLLLEGKPETDAIFNIEHWRAPSLSWEDISALRDDKHTQPLIERFIREILPFTHQYYHTELVPLLERLAINLTGPFWNALDTIAGPGDPPHNIDVIVTGALTVNSPDYEHVIERFASSEAEANAWMEGFAKDSYEAQEHAVDADAADYITEEPGERYFNAREGMKMVVRLRREREGVAWIAGHPQRKLLLYALGDLIGDRHRAPPIAELEFLLANADDWVRDKAWSAVVCHWDDALRGFLIDELARSDIDGASQRRLLIKIAAANGHGDPVPDLVDVARRVPFARRLELVYDVVTTKLDDDPKEEDGAAVTRARAECLLNSFVDDERELARALLEILAGGNIRTTASALTEPSRQLLATTLASASTDLTGPLACLAAGAGMNIDEAAVRLLSTDNAADGKVAIQALVIADAPELRTMLQQALKHKRYPVRRRAFQELAASATTDERNSLITVANDHSADVRLAFAELMIKELWPEAVDNLLKLLSDRRNYASHGYLGGVAQWSKFSVARAAARALGAYESLPAPAINVLLQAAQADNPDPFVTYAALTAIAKQDDTRIVPIMLSALSSPGLDQSPSHRPRSQAAAWAIFDRAISGHSDMLTPDATSVAERDEAPIAGPLLIAFGIHPSDARETLLSRLKASHQLDREALVRTAAIVVNNVEGMTLDDREQILLRLISGETVDSLSPGHRTLVESWSEALDVRSGFGRFIAWIVEKFFNLPLDGEIGDIRAYILPERIGVMNLRSLSPFREEDGGRVDSGSP